MPDVNEKVREELQGLISKLRAQRLLKRKKPEGAAPVDETGCPRCADGACAQHMKDEDASALESMLTEAGENGEVGHDGAVD